MSTRHSAARRGSAPRPVAQRPAASRIFVEGEAAVAELREKHRLRLGRGSTRLDSTTFPSLRTVARRALALSVPLDLYECKYVRAGTVQCNATRRDATHITCKSILGLELHAIFGTQAQNQNRASARAVDGRQQTAECRKHTDYGIINLWRACACAWSIDYREGGTARHGTARACVDALCHCEEIRARENSENKRRRQARRHHHVYVYSTVLYPQNELARSSYRSARARRSARVETKLLSANSQHSRGSHFTSYKHHSSVITSFVSQYST